jgi:hypothetical protein
MAQSSQRSEEVYNRSDQDGSYTWVCGDNSVGLYISFGVDTRRARIRPSKWQFGLLEVARRIQKLPK